MAGKDQADEPVADRPKQREPKPIEAKQPEFGPNPVASLNETGDPNLAAARKTAERSLCREGEAEANQDHTREA